MREEVPKPRRDFAKALRTTSTDAERRLWSVLRAGRLYGLKFRRQVPHKGFVLDFVCFEKKVVIEVDGGQHSGSISDRLRDQALEREGFLVLRFWNHEVLTNTDGVVTAIGNACRER